MPQEDVDKRLASRDFVMLVLVNSESAVIASLQVPTLTEEGSILPASIP
jgi:hypothetical protein